MLRALGEYHIGGIRSNISLFRAILNDSAFRAGDLHTGYLDQLLKTPLPPDSSDLAHIAALVAARQRPPAPAASSGRSEWLSAGRAEQLR
jgi:acetyl-CoA carboxylase biotin carboxylase subunit